MREQRLFSPARDNAVEYALQGRQLAGPDLRDTTFESALMDLEPYVDIAMEQAAARADRVEFYRLRALVIRIDPDSPMLARVQKMISNLGWSEPHNGTEHLLGK
jgi:protein TonB